MALTFDVIVCGVGGFGSSCLYSVCMYTMTPDQHFIVDRHPMHANVYFGLGFSGHGFKFTSVIGEALADLAASGSTEAPIEFLRLSRFGQAS